MRNDFDTQHLSGRPREIADAIVEFLKTENADSEWALSDGGCQAFWFPEEWKARGERYGTESLLVLVHDGGDLNACVNYDCGSYGRIARFDAMLKTMGVYVEACTGWYSAIYEM